MTYFAIFKDNGMLSFDDLSWLEAKKHIQYVFKKELYQTIKNTDYYGSPIKHHNYRYTLINNDGSPRNLRIGKFDLIDIGVDTRYFKKFTGREISLFDISMKTLRKFKSLTENEDFITKDLLPVFDILKLTNSWDIYVQLVELSTIKEKVVKLEAEIEKHKVTINDLKLQLKSSNLASS